MSSEAPACATGVSGQPAPPRGRAGSGPVAGTAAAQHRAWEPSLVTATARGCCSLRRSRRLTHLPIAIRGLYLTSGVGEQCSAPGGQSRRLRPLVPSCAPLPRSPGGAPPSCDMKFVLVSAVFDRGRAKSEELGGRPHCPWHLQSNHPRCHSTKSCPCPSQLPPGTPFIFSLQCLKSHFLTPERCLPYSSSLIPPPAGHRGGNEQNANCETR